LTVVRHERCAAECKHQYFGAKTPLPPFSSKKWPSWGVRSEIWQPEMTPIQFRPEIYTMYVDLISQLGSDWSQCWQFEKITQVFLIHVRSQRWNSWRRVNLCWQAGSIIKVDSAFAKCTQSLHCFKHSSKMWCRNRGRKELDIQSLFGLDYRTIFGESLLPASFTSPSCH